MCDSTELKDLNAMIPSGDTASGGLADIRQNDEAGMNFCHSLFERLRGMEYGCALQFVWLLWSLESKAFKPISESSF